MRECIGRRVDRVLRLFACQVRDGAVIGDGLVARHQQGGRRDLEQGRGGRRGAVGGGEEGRRGAMASPFDRAECCKNRVAGGFGIRSALEHEGCGAVAARVRAELLERGFGDWFCCEVRRRDDRHVEPSGAERIAGDIEGGEAGRAFRRDGIALAAQVFGGRDPVGGHVGHGAEDSCGLQWWCDAVLRFGVFGRAGRQAEFFRHAFAQQPTGGICGAAHADKDSAALGVRALDAAEGGARQGKDSELLGLCL